MGQQSDGQRTRLRILQVLLEIERGESGWIPGADEIASRTGIPIAEVIDHFDILEDEGRVTLYRSSGSPPDVQLTGAGKKTAMEGYPTIQTTQQIGTYIQTGEHSTFQNVVTSVGGTQNVTIGAKHDEEADLKALVAQLRQEIEGLSLDEDKKSDAMIDVEQMEAESRRTQPRLDRVADNAKSISEIVGYGAGALTTIWAFLKATGHAP